MHQAKTRWIRERHREWYLNLARQAELHWSGSRQAYWLALLERDLNNVRAALTWSLSGQCNPEPGLRLALGVWRVWDLSSHEQEGSDWLRQLLELTGDPPIDVRVWASAIRGYLLTLRGDCGASGSLLRHARALAEDPGDARGRAVALFFLGGVSADAALWDQAAAEYLESSRIAGSGGPRWVTYISLIRLADVARVQGSSLIALNSFWKKRSTSRATRRIRGALVGR
jgi:non-specific serine/threonine protein kinase